MGVSTSVAQLNRKLDGYAKGVVAQDKAIMRTALVETKRIMESEASAAAGSDLVLSGTGRTTGAKRSERPNQGKKLGVRYKLERGGIQGFVRATGPWQLVENDVPKHPVVSRHANATQALQYVSAKGTIINSRRSRQARGIAARLGVATAGDRRAVLHWGNQYRRWTVASSKGRHPWRKGLKRAEPAAAEVFRRRQTVHLKDSFR